MGTPPPSVTALLCVLGVCASAPLPCADVLLSEGCWGGKAVLSLCLCLQ